MFKTLFSHTRRYARPQGISHFSTSRPSMMTSVIEKGQAVLATGMIAGMLLWYVRESYRQK